MDKPSIPRTLVDLLRRAWSALSKNLAWKILSVIIALILWSYIISSDTSITQVKTLANVDVTSAGLTVLQSRDLALLTDLSDYDDIHVRVEASQSAYSRVTNDTVHVEVDLSHVTSAGVQQIELVGVTTYGKVIQITPSSIEVVIESLSSRYVPVNVELKGDISSSYWYNVSRVNPTQITVSGPSSIVRTISSARCSIDVTDLTTSQTRSIPLALLDEQSAEISATLARPSITEAMINVEVYPCVQLKVDPGVSTATVGALPEGYQITGIDIQPEIVTVAADQSLLDELDAISFVPVDVSERTSSFSAVAALNTLKDIKYISSEQVTVTVLISEIETSVTLSQLPLRVHGASSGQLVTTSVEEVSARATGLYTTVTSLTTDSVRAYVDVTGLEAGSYELPVTLSCDGHPELTLESVPVSVGVTVSDKN